MVWWGGAARMIESVYWPVLVKNRPGTHPGRLEFSVGRSETCLPAGRPIAYARRRLSRASPPRAKRLIDDGSGTAAPWMGDIP